MKNTMNARQSLGHAGELFVINYLHQQGFTVSIQNYRKFFGEIDIIAYKKNMYVFVEVKTRKSTFVPMGQLISPSKQQKIIKTAQAFISEQKLHGNYIYRFDVALLIKNNVSFSMDYIKNAFTQKEDSYGY